MSKLDDILDDQDWGYEYQMSDYATSKESEKKYERDGKRQIREAKQAIKDLFLELIDETKHQTGYCERLKTLKGKVEKL